MKIKHKILILPIIAATICISAAAVDFGYSKKSLDDIAQGETDFTGVAELDSILSSLDKINGDFKTAVSTTDKSWLVRVGNAYVELFRNIPLIVQFFVWYFVVPGLIPAVKVLAKVSTPTQSPSTPGTGRGSKPST